MTEQLEDIDPFYSWVGRCIKRWAQFESHLFDVCHWSLGTERRISAVIFFRTPNIEARISLSDDVFKAKSYPNGRRSGEHDLPAVQEWNEIIKAARENLKFRNFLAHQPTALSLSKMIDLGLVGSDDSSDYSMSHALVVHQHPDDRNRRRSALDHIGIDEMKAHYATVRKLEDDMRIFHGKLELS